MRIPDLRTEDELDEAALIDAIRTYVRIQARDWERRQLNRIFPAVRREVMKAQGDGNAIDVAGVIRKVFVQRELPAS